jgi:hypothetical protein
MGASASGSNHVGLKVSESLPLYPDYRPSFGTSETYQTVATPALGLFFGHLRFEIRTVFKIEHRRGTGCDRLWLNLASRPRVVPAAPDRDQRRTGAVLLN